MLGNLHVRFGVGVRVKFPGLHHVGELEPKRSRRREAGVESLDRCLELHQMPGNLDLLLRWWHEVSTVQQRIVSLAQRSPAQPSQTKRSVFTSLAHFMTLEWLESAYHATRKDGAAGIDEVTGKQYAENLEENLRALHERLKSGTYKAPPIRRKHIPKGTSGETRPIGIPTFEDKIVQRAVVMLLEPIYEHDFYDVSYGFRPGRPLTVERRKSLWRSSLGRLWIFWDIHFDMTEASMV